MSEDTLGFEIKVYGYKAIAEGLSGSPPSLREFKIQIEKLERMATRCNKDFPFYLALDKALRKKKGAAMHRLNQQGEAVDSVLMKLLEEYIRTQVPDITAKQRKQQLLPNIKKSLAQVDKQIHNVAQKMRKTFPPARRDLKRLIQRAEARQKANEQKNPALPE
jgi:hypothetical protein